jgi:hypothetical protein
MKPKSLFIAPPGEAPGPSLPPGPLKRLPTQRLFSLAALRRAWLKVKAVGARRGWTR